MPYTPLVCYYYYYIIIMLLFFFSCFHNSDPLPLNLYCAGVGGGRDDSCAGQGRGAQSGRGMHDVYTIVVTTFYAYIAMRCVYIMLNRVYIIRYC